MVDFIKKFRLWRRTKLRMFLPVEPNWISALSVIVSFGVWWNPIIAIALALTLDLLDGMVARGRHRERGEGKLTDWACDRYSEFVIFGYYAMKNPLVAVLPVFNTAVNLMAAGDRTGKPVPTLPLRQGLLLYLLWGSI